MDIARTTALQILLRCEERGVPMDPLFDVMVARTTRLSDVDKAFVRELVYGVMRWRARLDWILRSYADKPLDTMNRTLVTVLRLGIYQILFLDRVPAHAAVDESVRLSRQFRQERAAPAVNAILRGVAEGRRTTEFPDFRQNPLEHITAYLSHPRWMVTRWASQWGVDDTYALCEANNQIPPFSVRVNRLRGTRDNVMASLHRDGIDARRTPYSPDGLIIQKPPPLASWPPLQEGWIQVQDEASQLVGHVLNPNQGDRILDLCAAPGGKTTHLAELMNNKGFITAADISPSKLSLLNTNCRRLGISIVETATLDAALPLPFPQGSYDKVLVDAPCTNLGTIRRNPDVKWRVAPHDVARLQKLQQIILHHGSFMVRPGGVLVYGTCTLTPEENEGVVEVFLAAHDDFYLDNVASLLPVGCEEVTDPSGYLRTLPHRHGTDGFFAVRMQRKNSNY